MALRCKYKNHFDSLVLLRYVITQWWREISKLQWNLSITDILVPGIFGHNLLQYRGFPLSEVKNVLTRPVGTKIFVLIMDVFSIVSLIQGVC